MKTIEKIFNFIYPNVCGFCEEICKDNICEKCNEIMEKLYICNVNTHNPKKMYFSKHMYIFKYEGVIREKLINYKFNEKAYLYKTFGKIMLKKEKIYRFLEFYDIIIPVPMHKTKKAKRGYNQTELIAKYISKNIKKIQYADNVLIKVKNTLPQSSLNKMERYKNIKNAYKIQNKETINNKKILVFDDIYTTGNTVRECSKILKQNGAKEIGILTIAKD